MSVPRSMLPPAVTLSRALNVAIAALVLALAALVAAKLRPPPAEAPGFEDLHRAALERLDAGAADAPAALERARGAIGDPAAAELYARGIEHVRAGDLDLGEAALAAAARAERERWVEW